MYVCVCVCACVRVFLKVYSCFSVHWIAEYVTCTVFIRLCTQSSQRVQSKVSTLEFSFNKASSCKTGIRLCRVRWLRGGG